MGNVISHLNKENTTKLKPNQRSNQKKNFLSIVPPLRLGLFYIKLLWRTCAMNKCHHNLTSYFGLISLPSNSHKNGQFTYNTSQLLGREYNKLNCFIYPEAYKERLHKHKEVSSILYTFMIETKNFQKPALSKQNWA